MIVLSLQSGTSVDGIDAMMVEAASSGDPRRPDVTLTPRWAQTLDWEASLRARILAFADGAALTAGEFTELHTHAGQGFAATAVAAIAASGLTPDLVVSHGQTVFHWVESGRALGTLQIGDPSWIAEAAGAPVLSALRAADIAAGGQGAPLMGLFDAAFFGAQSETATLNLGGIANLQIPGVAAFDCGPANVLIDASVAAATSGALGFDRDGALAAAGTVSDAVLEQLLRHPYLALPVPKSTGRETFTLDVVSAAQDAAGTALELADLIATLTRFTAISVADALRPHTGVRRLVASGGGVRNPVLLTELRRALGAGPDAVELVVSDEVGLDPDFKESLLFALLGYCSWYGIPVSIVPGIARIAGTLTPGPRGLSVPEPRDGIGRLYVASLSAGAAA